MLSVPDRKMIEEEKKIFEGSNFDILLAPQPDHTESTEASYCSIWLSVNSLMIDDSTIIVEESEKNTIKFLESQGLKVIQCPFRDVYEFGGSFHCVTLDVRRQSTLESYFPNLDKLEKQ